MSSNEGPNWGQMVEQPLEQELSVAEKLLRDKFIKEYLVDFSPYNASIRIGYDGDYALQYAKRFMEEPYVLKGIAEAVKQPAHDPDQRLSDNKEKVMNSLIREANYRGPGSSHSARVAALSQLKSILGMEAPKKTQNTHEFKGGIMVIPQVASIEDWEKEAVKTQEKLADATRH